VVIDGYTQPGASPNTNGPSLGTNAVLMIELDGSRAGAGTDGLLITADNSTVRGLVINRFSWYGIFIGSGGNVIEGNFIGTDVTGSAGLGNGAGVPIFSASGNTIGGTTAGARNVISGNEGYGVGIFDSSTGNLVQGNFIGTDATGTVDLGNSAYGVVIYYSGASNNIIGGTTAEARNIISGNDVGGISLWNGVTGNLVQGNFIGTDVTGTVDLGNVWGGVSIGDASNNIVGGTTSGAGNIISGNDMNGVDIAGSGATGNLVQGNFIFSNAGLGIDLGGDGMTPNDGGDGDTGANNLQNFPVLTSATSGSSITIEGTLNSTANTEFRLEFFSNTACDPSGYGEGETFLGSTNVTTNGSGNVNFVANFPVTVPAGQFITSTATDPNNNTSEFSACLQVTTATVEATVDFAPDTLNLKSKGKWITCYIELPEGYDGEDIDVSTVKLSYGEDSVPAEWGDVQDGILMIKFDRSDVQDVLEPGDEVEITVSGELTDDTPFEGSDTIRVIE
jgi:hypothetical protein